LDLQPSLVNPDDSVPITQPLRAGIEFREVTYSYPGSKRAALNRLSLRIPAGAIVALVGPNGAGKSTVIKLLCRLYDPDAGSICLDHVDLREIDIHNLRKMVTVLFQEPVRYNGTVAENIRLGDIRGAVELGQITEAAAAAGASEIVRALPRGFDTLLGTMFEEGSDLSTGEWQRIALARAFLRQAPIIVLDEPTSAMDSWAEADWLRRFRGLAAGRTALIVTHRFTTAMQADTIHVLEAGRIIESGTHDELVALGGRYAESWSAQTRSRESP
jgi:ATP-binding cassette subfamily B protein